MPTETAEKKYVVEARVREIAAEAELRIGEDYLEALQSAVEKMIDESVVRAKTNGRKTLRSQDV